METKTEPAQVEMPESGEVVVCKITRVLDYGVFVELLEYEGLAGFIHVSEIASRWVKNIRNHVKENQIRAAKVLSIRRDKRQIDLSLTKVGESVQRAKIDDYKKVKRSQKLIEMVAEKQKKSFDDAWQNVAEPLQQNYETLYEALAQISLHGKEAAKGVPAAWIDSVVSVAENSIEVPKRELKGALSLSTLSPDGVEQIKKALAEAKGKSEDIEIFYMGSGKYSILAKAFDFKAAEKLLRDSAGRAIDSLKKTGGTGSFEKIETK